MTEARPVLITGAAGFVGRKLAAGLLRGSSPAPLVLTDRAGAMEGPEWRPLDITDLQQVSDLVREAKPKALIHLAAMSSVHKAYEDPRLTWRTNVLGTQELVQATLEHAPDCRFLYISSAEVYGRSSYVGAPVDESALLQPANPYAASKAAADILVQEAALRGLDAVIVRPFNHTGPGQTDTFVVPAFCKQIARIELGLQPPVIKVGELSDERDFMDVDDVLAFYLKALEVGSPSPEKCVFNIASGQPLKIGDILDQLIALATRKITVEIDPTRLRPNRVPRIVGCPSRAFEVFGWKATTPIAHTLQRTLDWWRAEVRKAA